MGAVALCCGRCKVDLPDGSQYCLKCGEPLAAQAKVSAHSSSAVCSCGCVLPPAAQFCPQCNQVIVGAYSPWYVPLRRPVKRGLSASILIAPVVLLALVWIVLSDSPRVHGAQHALNLSHTENVVPHSFNVGPKSFSVYKFTVPRGAHAVSVTGHFNTTGRANDVVEVSLLTEAEVVNWQYGYAPSSFYRSGRVAAGEINAPLPDGGGAYCLVFDNGFEPKSTKTVQISSALIYRTWWPSR